MAFKIRRGTDAERLTIVPAQGELIYTTDTKKLYVGDGITNGGNPVDDMTGVATTTYVDGKIDGLVDGAVNTLNTLKELADALGSDPNFASNLATSLSGKISNTNTGLLNPGDMYFTQTNNTVGMGSNAAQNVTVGPSGIQIAGTGGVEIMGVATATIKLGGGTSGNIIFNSPTTGINYNDLNNTPTGIATQTYVDNAVAGLVNNASSTLDTLKELADALGNDQNFATTVSTQLGQKANVADLADVATSGDYADLLNVPFTPNLSNVGQNILPDTDITWDLGSPTKKFRDLYLSTNTLYLGETALSVDPIKGLQAKTFGGGEGYGAGIVEWLTLPEIQFTGVQVSHPLYTYLSSLKKGDQLKEREQPSGNPGLVVANFLLTVTGPAVFASPVGGFVDVRVPVNTGKGSFSNNISGAYYIGYMEFISNVPTDISELTDTTGILTSYGGIVLTDLSVGPDAAASGNGSISYNNNNGVFTYTPPVIPTVPTALSSFTNDTNFITLSDVPTIPAAQIQSDWNQSTNTALDFIKNKPSIPNLNAVAQNILPDTDITYDIGSPTNRFKDIYLSSNTIYLGETALGIDPVKGLQVKSFGGGEGYGAGSVEWLDSGPNIYGVDHILKFNGVDISHPLYTYLSNLKIGDQIKEAVPPNNPTYAPPADFLLTVTGPVQFVNPTTDSFGSYINAIIPVDQSRTTGSTYYVFYVEFRNNPIRGIDTIPDPDGILPQPDPAGWPYYDTLGISTLRGDTGVFIRPSWDRSPTVDFWFKEDGTLQLPAGGDIVNSAGVSVLGGGSGGTGAEPGYKGFKAHYGRMFNSEPTLSKLVIYKDTASPSSVVDTSTEDDLFQVTGLTGSDVVALFVIAGSDNTNPVDLITLKSFVEAAIDNVILVDGVEGDVRNASDMKTAFYANYSTLAATAGSLYQNFQFLTFNNNFYVNTWTLRQGSGATFTVQDNGDTTYTYSVTTGGTNYRVGHKIIFLGSTIGGVDGVNDAIFTVASVDSNGAVQTVTVTGTAAGAGPGSVEYQNQTGTNYQMGSGLSFNGLQYNMSNDTLDFNGWGNGSGYVAGDVITILGTDIQSQDTNNFLLSPDNDVTLTINTVNLSGNISTYTFSGTIPRPAENWPTNYISDGGNDQYDTGNYISTNIETDISYNGGDVVTGSSAVGGGDYVVVYEDSIFGFFISGADISSIKTDGGSGFDGDGTADTGGLYGGGINLGDFAFDGNTMFIPGGNDDMYIKAGDDLFLDALDDDIHLRANDDIRLKSGQNFTDDTFTHEVRFNNSGEVIFYTSSNYGSPISGDYGYIRQFTEQDGFGGDRTVFTFDGNQETHIRSYNTNYTWRFGNNGILTTPGVIQGSGYELGLSPGADFTNANQTFRFRGGDVASHLHFDTSNSSSYDLYVGDDDKYFKLDKAGPAVIGTVNTSSYNKYVLSIYDGSITASTNTLLQVQQSAAINAPASNENPDNDPTDPDYVIWLVKADYPNYADITTSWTVSIGNEGVRRTIASVGDAANPTLYRIELADQTVVISYRADLKFYPRNSVWQFKDYGELELPPIDGLVAGPTVSSTVVTNNTVNYQGMVLTPQPNYSTGYGLKIYPGGPVDPEASHLHLTATDPTTVDLFLGDDDKYVKVAADGLVEISGQNGVRLWGEGEMSNTYIYLPNNADSATQSLLVANYGAGGILVQTGNGSPPNNWLFDNTGKLQLPAGGDIVDSTGTSVLGGGGGSGIALTDLSVGTEATPSGNGAVSYDNTTGVFTYTPPETVVEIATDTNTVGAGVAGTIWTDADSTNTMAKLLVNGVEATTGDSQSLEVLITKKSDNTVAATIYAIVHTSASPLFTVAADWDSGTSRMILDATVPGANNISFTVRSVTTEPGVGIAGGGSSLGNSDFSDILVVSAQAAGYWTSYSLTGDYAAVFAYQGNAVLSLTNQTVYGHQFAGGDKVLFINDAAINSNHYGLVIEFPSTPQLGDVVSVAVMGDSQVVNAGSFVVGRQYTVKDIGNTVWTSIGGQNQIGWSFIATGVGSGTGTAYAAIGVDRRIFKPASGQRIRIMAAGGNTASYYIGENETYKGAYVPTIGGQEAQTLLFTYVGVVGGTPTWYQLYF